jgi:leader peptidase (prepilin peptidase) / N-methyltransferase
VGNRAASSPPAPARSTPTALRLRLSRTARLCLVTASALAWGLCFERFGFGIKAIAACFFASVLIALSAIDLEKHILPNRIVLPAIAVLAAIQLAEDPGTGAKRLAWGGGAFGLFLILALVYPAGLGMGDVKLVFFLGLGLGRSVISAVVLGILAAGLVGLAVLLRYGSAGRKVALPFGPFLAAGSLVVLLTLGPR